MTRLEAGAVILLEYLDGVYDFIPTPEYPFSQWLEDMVTQYLAEDH